MPKTNKSKVRFVRSLNCHNFMTSFLPLFIYKKSERVVQKMNIKSGTMEQFGSFSQYQTLKEFKDNVGQWLLDYNE